MESTLKAILQVMLTGDEGETEQAPWYPYQNDLYVYIDLELDGLDAASRFPVLKEYLDDYETFREIYTELKALLSLERQGKLVQPPAGPNIDFSYLAPSQPSDWPWRRLLDTAGDLRARLVTEIEIVVDKLGASFGSLPEALTPQTVRLAATRNNPTEVEKSAQSLALPTLEGDLSFRLKIGPVSEGKTTLSTLILQTSTQQPLKSARITLRDKDRRMLESNRTQGNQEVVFRDIEAGSYFVEIKCQGQVWELPLIFAPKEGTADLQ